MNILMVIPTLEIGGAQTFLARYSLSLTKIGHKVYIYNMHPEKDAKEIVSQGLSDIKIFKHPINNLLNYFDKKSLLFRTLRKLLIKINFVEKHIKFIIKIKKIEILHSHMYLADEFIAKMDIKIPKISTWHGCYNLLENSYGFDKLKNISKKIFKNFNFLVIISEKQRDLLQRLNLNITYKKIYNGFILNEYQKINYDKKGFTFGMIARGDQTKGWEELIISFLEAKKIINDEKIQLLLVGDSQFLQYLKNKYKDNAIFFVGKTNNPLGWIEHFDVGVLPTYFPAESLPNSIIEYLALSKPVIATKWAEIPFMIKNQKDIAGILIDIKDRKPDINQLKKAIIKFVRDKKFYQDKSKIAKSAFKKFSMDICISEYLKIYSTLKMKK